MHVQRNTFWSVSCLTRAIVAMRSHNKLHNWHADSSRRSIVQLSRERTTPRISSWTSLKHCIHFSFILKLIIFIYKQLKRHVAFSAVHCTFTSIGGTLVQRGASWNLVSCQPSTVKLEASGTRLKMIKLCSSSQLFISVISCVTITRMRCVH